MSNRPEDVEEDDIPETDLSGAVRGKYYDRAMRGTNVVLLEPDVAKDLLGDPRSPREDPSPSLRSGSG
jgi:hypothetical protein